MKLIVKNIGMLKAAELTLHPLSLIAGENDNGKGTVGKLMFCIIKAVNHYKEDIRQTTAAYFREIFFLIRTGITLEDEEQGYSFIALRGAIESNLAEPWDWPAYAEHIFTILDRESPRRNVGPRIEELVELIDELLEEPDDEKQLIEKAFTKVFAAEFGASLLLPGESEGQIQLLDKGVELLNLTIDCHQRVRLHNVVEPIKLTDVTFIESPLVLDYHNLIPRSQTTYDIYERRPDNTALSYTTWHTTDLIDKLREPAISNSFIEPEQALQLNELAKIVGGEIRYSKQARDFVFRRGQQDVSLKNTPSSIKVFGLLQALLTNGFIGKNTLLVFDEPENHLHPKWQLALAKFLVELSQSGVYVLLSSHSPYMLEALKRYAERVQLHEQQAFYLAEEHSVKDEDRISEIFRSLSEPFEAFRQMDAEDSGK